MKTTIEEEIPKISAMKTCNLAYACKAYVVWYVENGYEIEVFEVIFFNPSRM